MQANTRANRLVQLHYKIKYLNYFSDNINISSYKIKISLLFKN